MAEQRVLGRLADLLQHLPAARAFLALRPGPARRRRPPRRAGVKAPAGASPSTRSPPEVMQISARSRPFIAARYSGATWTCGAACRLEPMRFSARSSSSAPVTTRRRSRTVFHLSPSAASSQRVGDRGIERADARSRPRRPARPWGAHSQASSAVKQVIGASHAVRKREQLGHHRARGAPAQRLGRVAVDRVLADVEIEGREIDRAEIVQLGARWCGSRSRRPPGASRRRARPGDAAPSARAPAVCVELDLLGRREAVEAAQQVAQACCAAGDRPRPGASGSPGRCAGPRCSRCRPPTGAGCRRRTGRTPPAAR